MKRIFILVLFALLLSCHGKKNNTQSTTIPGKEEQVSREISREETKEIPPVIMKKGEDVYRKHCMACHQGDMNGIKGMYPPLSETKTVNGDPKKIIGIVLNGLAGEIEVKGEKYNHVMIPHNFLGNREIADLLTYVRNSYGNSAGRISEDEVEAVRREMN